MEFPDRLPSHGARGEGRSRLEAEVAPISEINDVSRRSKYLEKLYRISSLDDSHDLEYSHAQWR